MQTQTDGRKDDRLALATVAELLRTDEVFLALRVSRATLYRKLRDDPTFPRPVRLGPKTLRWRRRDLDAWLERQGMAA